MGIGTFGAFTQARLGIYAAQTGLSVTGNNIANINTTGYTRQKLDQTSFYAGGSDRYYSAYEMRTGNGVLCTSISQLRDPYLDIRYRSEMSSVGAMDTKLAGLENIQRVLDEVGDGDDAFGILGAQLSDFFNQLQQLSDQTGLSEYDIQVRSSAESLVKQFNSYAAQLTEVYNNAVKAFEQDVTAVNNILTSIRDLSASIRKAEIHGDNALELRDKRNVLIDKLSSYMKIDVTYTEEDAGGIMVEKLVIKLGDANPDGTKSTDETVLVDGIYARQLSVKHPKENPHHDPDDPKSFPYLDKAGKPVATEDEALWEFNENFNVVLEPLEDSKGRALITTEKSVQKTTNYPGQSSVTTPPDANGVTTITTYAKSGMGPAENPNWDGIDSDAKYLKDDGTTTGDATQAKQVDAYIKTTYTKTPSSDVVLHDNDLYGSLQSQRELLTEKGEFATAEMLAEDPNAAGKRGIQFYQKALDLLANKFADTFNKANYREIDEKDPAYQAAADKAEAAKRKQIYETYVDKNGVERYAVKDGCSLDDMSATYTDTKTGETKTVTYDVVTIPDGVPKDIRVKIVTAQRTHLSVDQLAHGFLRPGAEVPENTPDNSPMKQGGILFSNSGTTDNPEGITAANISISLSWSKGPLIVNSFDSFGDLGIGSTDSSNILHMIAMMETKMDYSPKDIDTNAASGASMFKGTFHEMWVNLGAILGNDMMSTSTLLDTYYASSVELDTGRNSVSGVDLNDEAMNLMQYSKSYNAACRLMTTLDSVLDKLINGTGMTT